MRVSVDTRFNRRHTDDNNGETRGVRGLLNKTGKREKENKVIGGTGKGKKKTEKNQSGGGCVE